MNKELQKKRSMECLNLMWDDIDSEIVNKIVKNKNKLVKKEV